MNMEKLTICVLPSLTFKDNMIDWSPPKRNLIYLFPINVYLIIQKEIWAYLFVYVNTHMLQEIHYVRVCINTSIFMCNPTYSIDGK